jgi:hypothetical protein
MTRKTTQFWHHILLVTQCTIVLIRKNIGSIKFISGEAEQPSLIRYFPYSDNCTLCNEFILILQPNLISNVFHIRTMNLSWFWIHTTMYLTFQFLKGYGILSWFCLHISPLTPFFFHIMTINLSCFCIHIIKFNIKSTV